MVKRVSTPPKPIAFDALEDVSHPYLNEELYLRLLDALDTDHVVLEKTLSTLHPADIADLIERLPRERRGDLIPHLPQAMLGETLAELDAGVQEHVLGFIKPEQVKEALADMDSDDAADLAQAVEDASEDENGPDAEDLVADHQQKRLLDYDPDSAGGLMQIEVVTARPTDTVSDMLAYLRENEESLPVKPGTIFVINPHRRLLGTVSLSRLVRVPLTASMETIMRRDPLHVFPETGHDTIIKLFEKYDIHNLAVVNARHQLLGRISIDDVLDVVLDENARVQARSVGLDEHEDLFAPPLETVRHRFPWLAVNLFTAIAAASVIALFRNSIAQLVTLAILMPIVASMGGNATTQAQTVVIRALALGQITRQNAWDLLKKEFLAGGYLGTVLALVMAVGTGLLYQNWMLALVIALATLANHLIAAAAGFATPLVLKRFKYDPAIATGVITTTFTDVGGFFVFLGLATWLLL